MADYVIFSTDAHPNYAFFAPLTALMWREVAGYESLVTLVGEVPDAVPRALADLGVRFAKAEPPPGVGKAAFSQLVRLFAYCDKAVVPDDYVLMGDCDAWPLAREPFWRRDRDVLLMYALDAMPTYPIGYIGAPARIWHEWLTINAPTPAEGVKRLHETDAVLVSRQRDGYNYDETLISGRIRAWPGHPDRCLCVERPGFPIQGRIDRARWPQHPKAAGMIDAHLLRPGATDANWPRLRPLLEQCLEPRWLAWCDNYRSNWR